MEGCFGYREIQALRALIDPRKDESDPEDDLPQAAARKVGPGDISVQNESLERHSGPHAKIQGQGDEIWHPSEATSIRTIETHDPREVPEYEMKFKQAVTAEDVFLGVSGITIAMMLAYWATAPCNAALCMTFIS